MNAERLTPGQRIAAIAGAALFILMFLPWFGVELDAGLAQVEGGSVNAWESFGGIDLLLLITAIAAVALPLMAAANRSVELPIATSALIAGLGVLATILVLYRLIDPPGPDIPGVEYDRRIGVWLGLLAAGAVAYGGWQAMQEEGTSFSQARDQLGGAFSGDREQPPPPRA